MCFSVNIFGYQITLHEESLEFYFSYIIVSLEGTLLIKCLYKSSLSCFLSKFFLFSFLSGEERKKKKKHSATQTRFWLQFSFQPEACLTDSLSAANVWSPQHFSFATL